MGGPLYRNSQETLGEVIKHCFVTREAMWEIPLPVSRPPRPEADRIPGAAPKRKPQKPAGGGGGRTPKGADAPNAETLRDGSRLCRNFNTGNTQVQQGPQWWPRVRRQACSQGPPLRPPGLRGAEREERDQWVG